MATQLIFTDNPGSLDAAYTLPAGLDLKLASIVARIDGSAAAGPFLPCLAIFSQDGHLMARVPTDETYQPGDTGVVTYAPFLRKAGGAAAVVTQPQYARLARFNTAQSIPSAVDTVIAWDQFTTTNTAVFYTTTTPGGAPNNTAGDKYLTCTGVGYLVFMADVLWGTAVNMYRKGLVHKNAGDDPLIMSQISELTATDFRDTPSGVMVLEAPLDGIALTVNQGSGVNQPCNARLACIFIPSTSVTEHDVYL